MANKSKYRELLDYCDKYKLSIYDMNIASEVEFAFKDSGGRDRDDFDALCDLTSDVYLHVDSDISLSSVASAVATVIICNRKTVNDVSRGDVIDYII